MPINNGSSVICGGNAFEPGQYSQLGTVYYNGAGDCAGGFISKKTMRERTDALIRQRAEAAHRRALKANTQIGRISTVNMPDAATGMKTGTEEKDQYFGFVVQVRKTDLFGSSAQVLTSAGMLETTVAKHYRDSTLPNVGTLVYKRSGQLGIYNLIAKKDPQYFGCIVQLSTPYSRPAITTITTTAGRRVDMHDHQLCNPDDSRVGSLVCRLPGDGRYVVQAGK